MNTNPEVTEALERTEIGPNVRRLISRKMALLAIPVGSGKESFSIGLDVLTNREKFASIATEASAWVQAAIDVMKTAPDNPYGDDDEAIAGALLKGIEEREALNAKPKDS